MAFQLPAAPEKGFGGLSDADSKKVSISLEFWHSGSQCLSDWNNQELKKLRKAIDKVQTLTASGVRTDPGLQWKLHSGRPLERGFSKPTSMPKEYTLSELRVSDKARLHGCLVNSSFFLVWLDRNHAVFPSGK